MHVSASRAGVPTPAIFAWPGARKNACWGAPQTRCTSGQSVQRCLLSAAPALPLLGLVPLVRVAEQTVDVPLDRHSLPHIRLGLAVLRILGKPVRVCEFMPDAASGNKPIAFGDFSYYWVVLRTPFSLRTLTEKFVLNDQIGYLALEYLDGKLVRRDAVKVLQMK